MQLPLRSEKQRGRILFDVCRIIVKRFIGWKPEGPTEFPAPKHQIQAWRKTAPVLLLLDASIGNAAMWPRSGTSLPPGEGKALTALIQSAVSWCYVQE